MSGRRGEGGLALAMAMLGFAAALNPSPVMAQAQPLPKWAPSIDFEAKPGNKRQLGEADAFVPLWQDSTTLMFGSLRGRIDTDDNREGNLGLGVRHMMQGGWNLGGYAYYDRRRTEADNHFNQATLGVEALGIPLPGTELDLRANAYLPFGSTVRGAGVSGGGPSTASIVGASVQVSSPGVDIREERALKGFDAEIGLRVPIWSLTDDKAMRVYAGAYRFDSSATDAVVGPRVRAEMVMYRVPGLWDGARLTFGAEYQHDDLRRHQGFGLARLRIPLQFFGTEAPSRLNAQERRMTDPVVRDVDIVSAAAVQSLPTVVETATRTAGGQTLTVIDGAQTAAADVPTAVAAAGQSSVVVLAGSFTGTASTAITLNAGQTLMGEGALNVVTPSGRGATLNAPRVSLNSSRGAGPAVIMANDSTLQGLTILGSTFAGDATAVSVSGVSNVTIANNTLTGTAQGGGFASRGLVVDGGSSNVQIRNNSITGSNGPNALGLVIDGSSAVVAGNAITGATSTVVLTNATILAGSTGNTSSGGGCADNGGNTGAIGFTNAANCP